LCEQPVHAPRAPRGPGPSLCLPLNCFAFRPLGLQKNNSDDGKGDGKGKSEEEEEEEEEEEKHNEERREGKMDEDADDDDDEDEDGEGNGEEGVDEENSEWGVGSAASSCSTLFSRCTT